MRRDLSASVLAVVLVAACGGEEGPCKDAKATYPGAFSGTAAGDVDGKGFAANLNIVRATDQEQQLEYRGTMEGTGASSSFRGEIHFGVSCASGTLAEDKGWSQVPGVGNYPRGEIEGVLQAAGGTGTWSCSSFCKGGGTWSLK